VFAVLVALAFVKVKKTMWPRFVQVRRETFGLYLSHAILLDIVLRSIQTWFRRAPASWLPSSGVGLVIEWLTTFALTYGAGIMVARKLAGWNATQWLVGLACAKYCAERERRVLRGWRGAECVAGAKLEDS